MAGNSNLTDSRAAKADEFYTPLSMIENELKHYKPHFKNKTVLCNCDDPRISNFFRYFVMYFDVLELKKVIATCYKNDDADLFSQEATEKAVYLEYDGKIKYTGEEDFEKIPCKELKRDGDFRSADCVEFLKRADIVVTNPPFSLFKEYVPFLFKYEKKFLIIGNINNITYNSIIPLIKDNKM
ncbi:MAG: restriction endonuclease subunit M, partial [Treponema sp.]|nr:restriction endonuclease subunit M [Treponema sp.]